MTDGTGPWIRTVAEGEAEGVVKAHYDAAIKRAGKVFNIVKIMSLRPDQLRTSLALYRTVMLEGEGGLTRGEREMLATVVSRANDCFY